MMCFSATFFFFTWKLNWSYDIKWILKGRNTGKETESQYNHRLISNQYCVDVSVEKM